MSNVLNEEKRQQVIALGRLGWSLRKIQKTTGVRRETAADYLRAAGVAVRPPGALGTGCTGKTANEATPDPPAPKPANRTVRWPPILTKVSEFLKRIKVTAEQSTQADRWKLILSAAFRSFVGGKVIGSSGRVADAAV